MENHRSGEGYNLEEYYKVTRYAFEYSEIHHEEVEDVSYHPDSTQIISPIQTQQPGKQETGSGCLWKSNNDFERSARLYVWNGGQCLSIKNILFPSQSWPLWTGDKKEAMTEKDASKSSYGVCGKKKTS